MSRLSPLPLQLLLLGTLVVVVPACGKRGPPLPPLRLLPDQVTDVAVVRREGQVALRFRTPVRNVDGSQPVRFDHAEVYALTVLASGVRPTAEQVLAPKNRVGTVSLPPPPPAPVVAPAAGAAPEAPAAVTLSFSESVATIVTPPGTLAAPKPAAPVASTPTPTPPATAQPPRRLELDGPAAAAPAVPQTLQVATRFYAIVPYASSRRHGNPSEMLAVPLGPLPVAPKDLTIAYDEQNLTFKWTAGGDGQSFHVYDAAAADATPLTNEPLGAPTLTRPTVFGQRVCFAVRGVRTTGPVTLESGLSATKCDTPADTFAPADPSGLTAFAAEGVMTLSWDPVTASDLAGYIVLRGEGADERLQPLMTTPVTDASFKDTTTRAGVRYVYAVIAVDRATPANRSKESNRVTETGR